MAGFQTAKQFDFNIMIRHNVPLAECGGGLGFERWQFAAIFGKRLFGELFLFILIYLLRIIKIVFTFVA